MRILVYGAGVQGCELAHRLLHRVGGGQGVEGLAGDVGQGEGRQGLGLRTFVLLTVKLGQLVQRVGAVQVLTAGEDQQEQCQQQGQQSFFQRVPSPFRQMTAACSPRRRPVRRWLQYRSGRQ